MGRLAQNGHTTLYLPMDMPIAGTDLTANTALTLMKLTPGFEGDVVEFGYIIDSLSTGTPALVFQLQDASSNVIAQLTLSTVGIVTSKARGDVQSTAVIATTGDGIRPAFKHFFDGTRIDLKRISGTAATGTGTGRFFVKVATRPQQQ